MNTRPKLGTIVKVKRDGIVYRTLFRVVGFSSSSSRIELESDDRRVSPSIRTTVTLEEIVELK